jgi:hypothetical protein
MNWNKAYKNLSQKKWYESLKKLDSFVAKFFPIIVILFILFFALLITYKVCYCPKKKSDKISECIPSSVILDDKYYLEKIKNYAYECNFDAGCMNRKVNKNVPKKYYVHIRKIKSGWEFACIDTTKPGHEEELKNAKLAAEGK